MKTFLYNLLEIVVIVILIAFVDVWAISVGIIVGIPVAILSVLKENWKHEMTRWYRNVVVLPYKWLGICEDWDEFTSWIIINL